MTSSQLVKTPLWEHQRAELLRFKEVPRVLCAWEMGTGKTLFAVERDLRIRVMDPTHKRTLVVAPRNTLDQWKNTFEREYPGIKVVVIDRKNRNAFLRQPAHVFIAHWDVLRLMPELKGQFTHGIFDEVHAIKNAGTKVARATKKLKIPYLTDMSGSPATDRSFDIWSILNHLYPREWSSGTRFKSRYLTEEVQIFRDKTTEKLVEIRKPGGPNQRWFDEGLPAIEPYYSRKKVEECLDLPEKIYTTIALELGPKQRAAYDAMNEDMLAWVNSKSGEEIPLIAPAIISKLQRLQQFAVASMEYDEDEDRFTMQLPSAKLEALLQLIQQVDGEQFVVFSQFKQPLYLLEEMLNRKGISSVTYTGDTKDNMRTKYKEAFSRGDVQVFLSTIKSGGTGVDSLQTNCHNMVFIDRDWSPMVNDQAEARLWRGGQKHPVQIFTLVARNTVDFPRRAIVELKKKNVIETLEGRTKWTIT